MGSAVSDKDKQATRAIQEATGLPYIGALNIVRGIIRYEPKSPECRIKAAIEGLSAKLRDRIRPTDHVRPCTCAACDP